MDADFGIALWGCAGTFACVWLWRHVLIRVGALDVPNARSSHTRATPRGAGVAIIVVFVAVSAFGPHQFRSVELLTGLAAVVAGAIGAADDLRGGLSISSRFASQTALAIAVAWTLVSGSSIDSTGVSLPVGLLIPVTALWLVAFTNAFNFMDGINGISGVTTIIAGSWYFAVLRADQSDSAAWLALLLATCAFGFLPWNTPRARIFLGDSGSYFLGFMLGALAAITWDETSSVATAVAPLIIYLTDTGVTLARRIVKGERWRSAHREHVYQRLADITDNHVASAAIVGTLQVTCLLVATLIERPWLQLIALGTTALFYLSMPRLAGKVAHPRRT